jgi:hypothetical protein
MSNKQRRAIQQSVATLRSKAARESSPMLRAWYTQRALEAASKLEA